MDKRPHKCSCIHDPDGFIKPMVIIGNICWENILLVIIIHLPVNIIILIVEDICFGAPLVYLPIYPLFCQACVARGDSEEQLRVCTQTVVKAIADYKHASKTAKGLESQSKPKPKAKAKAKAAASSAPEENP